MLQKSTRNRVSSAGKLKKYKLSAKKEKKKLHIHLNTLVTLSYGLVFHTEVSG